MHEVSPHGQAPGHCSLQGEGMEGVGDLKLCRQIYAHSQCVSVGACIALHR